MGFDDNDTTENKINKMMKMIPGFEDFQRMMANSPEKFGRKPEFTDDLLAQEWDRARYKEFRAWNLKCLNGMYTDNGKHLEWLCEWISKGKVRNMDMECCGEFYTEGIYFNMDMKLVIYNGR